MARLDFLVGAAVRDVGRENPPAAPLAGDCHIVGDNPDGDWAGKAQCLASFTESGWRFAAATAGMKVLDLATGCEAQFDGTVWRVGEVRAEQVNVSGIQVIGSQQAAIGDHASDATINAILAALRTHGLIAP